MPAATIAGLRAYYVGSGEPLVLLHGLGTGSDAWGPVLSSLSARHEVLAVDLPGFGGSPPLPDGALPTPEALTDAVERVLDQLGLLAAHVCGNSLGGWIALELARRRRARSLVLVSPAGFWNEAERRFALASLKVAHREARALAPGGRAAMALPPVRTAFFAQIRRRPRRLSIREAAHQVRMSAKPEFALTRDVTLDGRRAAPLEEMPCPTLILWGTRDLLLPIRQSQDALAAIPGARLERLRGLGHVPMADDPARVAEAILDFTSRPATAQA